MEQVELAETTTFKDAKGREWDTKLTLGTARQIDRSDFTALGLPPDFTILKPSREFFTTMLTDPQIMFALVWAVVHPQAKNHKDFPSVETDYDNAEMEFVSAIDGDALERGRAAFWRAISDFFPKQKTALLTLMRKYTEAEGKIATGIANMDQKIGAVLDKEIAEQLANLEAKLDEATLGGT